MMSLSILTTSTLHVEAPCLQSPSAKIEAKATPWSQAITSSWHSKAPFSEVWLPAATSGGKKMSEPFHPLNLGPGVCGATV
mmetsp:Transcript_18680/g.29749  ORF Transcript_18680/g.29749 Transcript_18680/m.29749 type:complete len:81 (+) Transcript_18680:103-345(+)